MNLLILVVDDEPDVEALFRQQFRHDLRAGRFTMEFAQSAPVALQRIADAAGVSIILILSDINMPGMTGIELLGMIRLRDKETPVILMTAYAELDMAVSAVKNGAYDFIIKPYQPHYLLHAIEKAAQFRRLRILERTYTEELERTVQQRTAELAAALHADPVLIGSPRRAGWARRLVFRAGLRRCRAPACASSRDAPGW